MIELTRGGQTEYALFMMDSGSSKEFDAGTAGIDDAQVEWYNWNMNAFEAKCGEKPTRKPAKGGAVTSFAVGLWAQKVLEKIIERRPDAELLYYLGNLHYDRRNYDTAASAGPRRRRLTPTTPRYTAISRCTATIKRKIPQAS